MKRILTFSLLLCASIAMWATKTLYLVPNSNWTQANAKLAVYYYNNSAGTNGWSSLMTAVAGETNVFSTTIPDGFTSIIFVRLDSKATTGNWNDKWNQSADLTLPDGKDLFVMADGWDAVSGTWQTYSAGTPIVVPTKSVPSEAPDVMLQAFYWDSYQDHGYGNNRWSTMLSQAEEIGSYFDLVWFPPCSQSSGGTGYIPKQYSNLNSDWGSESDLRALISALHNKGTRAVADIVVNHITGNYGWCSFASMNFGEYGTFNPDASWICQTDEMNSESSAGDCRGKATGANDDGYGSEANYTAARDWDHTNPQVQAMCRAYLQWLKNDVGFDGWRYDYGKGFHHSHINDYNTAAGAYLSVVEYWDGNPDVIRQRLEDASWNNMAFDFGTKYDALNNGICSYNYAKCQGAGMLGAGLAKHAVTFVDNHDTFTRNDSEFGGQNNSMSTSLKDRLLQANAYILSMPGIPCVFYPHWVTYKSEIKAMIEARHLTGVHSESQVKDESASATGYQATIVGKNGYIVLQLGDKASGTINGFTKKASGNGYAIWIYTNNAVPVDPNAPKFYITGDSALVVDAGLDKSKAWAPDAIKSEKDTLELTLKADTYYTLKLTTDGTWNTAKGYNDLSEKAAGLEDNGNDHNIGFKLKAAGKVQVIYFVKDNKTTFLLSGNFVTKAEPVDPEQPTDSTTVYFVNTLNWTKVNTFVWPAEGEAYKSWPGEAAAKEAEPLQGYDVYAYTFPAKYVNVIFNNGDTQTVDLTWSAAKPYFVPTDKTAEGNMQGTWYAKADVPAAPEPVVPAKFYITGDSALVVDAGLDKSKAWAPDAIKSEKDTLELTLKADTYYTLKLTTDGTWNTAKGYNDLSDKAAGLEDNGNDHNIGFKLKDAGKVQVIYFVKDNKTTFLLSGNFVTKADPVDPVDPEQPTDSTTVYFVNTLNWTKVNTFVWPAEGEAYKSWPGEAAAKEAEPLQGYDVYAYTFPAKYVNVIFNNGDTQTVDLTWSAAKPYFVPTDKTAEGKMQGTWYAKADVPAAPEPVVPAKFYITGDSALVVDAGLDKSKAWAPDAIKSEKDTLELTLKADTYYTLKLTTDGTWNTAKGYNDLSEKAAGLEDNGNDHNIGFKLKDAGKVQVIYFVKDNKTTFQLSGNFVTKAEPVDPEQPTDSATVYFVNTLNWTTVNTFVWPAEGEAYKAWPGEAAAKEAEPLQGYDVYAYTFPAKYVNVIFNNGNTQTVDLTWSAAKPYFVPSEKNAGGKMQGTWYAKADVPAAPEPVVPAKFYITGDSALVVDAGLDKSKAWSPDAIKSEKDTLELTLKADTYYTLKLTTDGTWNTAKGYNDLSDKAAGLEDNGNDHNIGFKLKDAGKVQVIYFVKDNKTTFLLSGNFVTKAEPVDPEQPTDSATVYFVNTLNWTTVNTFVWPAEGNAYKAWPGEAAAKEAEPLQGYDVYAYTFPAKYVNVIFNNGNTQTVDLTWSAAKPYFVPSEKNADGNMQGTWYAKADVPAAPEPVVPAKFYITGDSALVVDAGLDKSKAWSPDAIKSEKDTLELTLKADTYYTLKLTTDGTWNTAKGYNDLSEKAAGLEDNGNDHNIGFKLKTAGKVQVIYFVKDNKTTFQLSGNFVTKTDPVDPEQPTDSTTVYFVNTLNWTKVNTFVWPAEGNAYKAWPGEAAAKEAEQLQGYDVYAYTFPAKYVNVIFNNGDIQTVDLTWSAAKPYFVPTDKTAEGKMQGTWYAKADVPAAPEPVVPAKFYITGDSALVVDAGLDKSKAWAPDAIKSEKDTLELTLKADTYYTLKLTTDGTWNTAKGYNDLSEKAAGLEDNGNDHNIGFKLKAAGKVQVIYFVKDNKTTFQLSGNFVTKTDPIPTVADGFYLMGTMNGWKADENYLFVPNETTEGEYMLSVTLTEGDELKVAKVMNGVAMTWYPAEGANFVVSATHAGKKVIYFREQYNADWADFGGYIYIANDIAEGIHDTTAEQPAVKVIINNCLLIRRGTRTYTVAGELVR